MPSKSSCRDETNNSNNSFLPSDWDWLSDCEWSTTLYNDNSEPSRDTTHVGQDDFPPTSSYSTTLPPSKPVAGNQFEAFERDENGFVPPPYSRQLWVCLLEIGGPKRAAKLQDIYGWFRHNTQVGHDNPDYEGGWDNGVRHNLSLNQAFKTGRRSWWHIPDEAFNQGVISTSNFRNDKNKRLTSDSTKRSSARARAGARGGAATAASRRAAMPKSARARAAKAHGTDAQGQVREQEQAQSSAAPTSPQTTSSNEIDMLPTRSLSPWDSGNAYQITQAPSPYFQRPVPDASMYGFQYPPTPAMNCNPSISSLHGIQTMSPTQQYYPQTPAPSPMQHSNTFAYGVPFGGQYSYHTPKTTPQSLRARPYTPSCLSQMYMPTQLLMASPPMRHTNPEVIEPQLTNGYVSRSEPVQPFGDSRSTKIAQDGDIDMLASLSDFLDFKYEPGLFGQPQGPGDGSGGSGVGSSSGDGGVSGGQFDWGF